MWVTHVPELCLLHPGGSLQQALVAGVSDSIRNLKPVNTLSAVGGGM